jgi:hypothetical protein
MSIYATLAEIGIRRFRDKEFVAILVQGVPPHIDHVGPAWDFLPPPVDPEGTMMRAVFFVEPGDEKGTSRCRQEYVRPLLMMTGEEYGKLNFPDVIAKLEEALDAKYGKRPGMIFMKPDGTQEKIF